MGSLLVCIDEGKLGEGNMMKSGRWMVALMVLRAK
jgi:hypothetical protein